ncbi:MAG: amidohydrolase family protein [Candidatus Marsarchaeota archaeon]|nr:amidohydrolase family protein [Candidatus Marsarchaeota archaeon]
MFIRSKRVYIDGKLRPACLSIHSGHIGGIHSYTYMAGEALDAGNWMVLPGAIDVHTHMREPEASQKEDFYSGSAAALAGGVTTYFDMPCYNGPATATVGALSEKERLAAAKSVADYGFHLGATNENGDLIRRLQPPSVKAFLSDTHSILSLTPSGFERACSGLGKGLPLLVHCEDRVMIEKRAAQYKTHEEIRSPEVALSAVKFAAGMGKKYKRRMHFCHLTTAAEVKTAKTGSGFMPTLDKRRKGQPLHTVEVSPHHLFLSTADLDRLKGWGMVNPPLRERREVAKLWKCLKAVDMIASDHAPHLPADKDTGAPGFPGVQTMVPLLLHAVVGGKLALPQAVRLFAEGPAAAFTLQRKGRIAPGYDADLILFNPQENWNVNLNDLHSKAGWSPYEGWKLRGKIFGVFLRGEQAVWDGELGVRAGFGKPVQRLPMIGTERLDLRKHAKERYSLQ